VKAGDPGQTRVRPCEVQRVRKGATTGADSECRVRRDVVGLRTIGEAARPCRPRRLGIDGDGSPELRPGHQYGSLRWEMAECESVGISDEYQAVLERARKLPLAVATSAASSRRRRLPPGNRSRTRSAGLLVVSVVRRQFRPVWQPIRAKLKTASVRGQADTEKMLHWSAQTSSVGDSVLAGVLVSAHDPQRRRRHSR
jgi:hypothetical protein